VLPNEVLKAIDSMVAAKMREQFPPSKRFTSNKLGFVDTKTWSSRDLRKLNSASEKSFNLSKLSALSNGPPKVDSETRNKALSEWNKRKRFESTLRSMLIQQALHNVAQDKLNQKMEKNS